jgi:hypothetical protein
VYLALPKQKESPHEGSIEFSTDGDEYPREHENFPSKVIDPSVGDIVLFPSSLFHRTIPFSSDEDRVCVAFDLKPLQSLKAFLVLAMGWLSLFVADAVEIALTESYLFA